MTVDAHTNAMKLFGFAQGFQKTQALYTFTRLGLAEALDQPRSLEEVADHCQLEPSATRRLLYLAEAMGLVAKNSDQFTTTSLGAMLRMNHPQSFARRALFFGEPFTWGAWGKLSDCLRTGATGYELAFGANAWEIRAEHPDTAEVFNAVMQEITQQVAPLIAMNFPFPAGSDVLDIGGGTGELIRAILHQHSDMTGTLMDLPEVIEEAKSRKSSADIEQRLTYFAGDIFESIPAGHGLLLLARVLHDWTDQQCITLLHKVVQAMSPDSRLLVLERVIQPDRPADPIIAMSDMTMLVGTGGHERTLQEFQALGHAAGLHLHQVWDLPSAQAIMEYTLPNEGPDKP
ncbi:methyltransferase [Cutibacterium sp. V947]|uniref:methyltransferase n=1 Tax=unclassified Cutibacterium TaxID=2649671 RepID=UPI003EE28551